MTFRMKILICALASASASAAKSEVSAADQQLMSGYVLSMDTLNKYERAIAATDAACKDDRRLQEQAEDAAMHPGESLEQAIKRIGKSPFFTRYLQPAGLEARDAVLLPVALIGAGAVVEMNADVSKLPGLSNEQVTFYRSHQAELKGMRLTGTCGEDAD